MASPAYSELAKWVRRKLSICFILAVSLSPLSASAESEYSVKAAYLVNFAKLVQWPASAFASPQAKIVVGLVGRGPAADEVAQTLAGASAGGRALEIRRVGVGDTAGLSSCHVVFILDAERAETVVGSLQGRPVLTVGESEDFARKGGAIGFVRDGGTVKFEANAKAASRNGLTVSAKLLRVARSIVN
jgi:hypothetical protein